MLLRQRIGWLVVLVALVGACNSAGEGTSTTEALATTTTAAPAATTTTAVASTTTATEATTTTTTEATTTTTAPAEDAEMRITSFVPSITMTAPPEWKQDPESALLATTFVVQASASRYLAFSREGPDTVEGWLEYLESLALELGETAPVEVGGAEGFVVDARISDAAGTQNCPPGLVCTPVAESWFTVEGYPNRFWVVDVDGETLMMVAEAIESDFETWVTEVEEVLATLEWG